MLGGSARLRESFSRVGSSMSPSTSVLARWPEVFGPAEAVGLGGLLQPATATGASMWTRSVSRPMLKGHVMGVPDSEATPAGLLSDDGLARMAHEPELEPTAFPCGPPYRSSSPPSMRTTRSSPA